MKIFISWSGDFSREVAEKLSVWIPSILQSVNVFFSPDDIGKGENWNNILSKELNDCNFGIVCLTPENVAAPWIHFEAGALAKTLNSHLSSIMLGINTSEVKGPLSRFQNTKFERNDFFKLLQTINEISDKPLEAKTLSYLFEALWGKLEIEITTISKKYESIATLYKSRTKVNDSDAIQEILSIVRKMSSNTAPSIVGMCLTLKKRFSTKPLSDETKTVLRSLLPDDVTIRAIQILENGDPFYHTIPVYQDKALEIIKLLLGLSDITVATKRTSAIN